MRLGRAWAMAEMERHAGSQFDPELVRLFVAILRQRTDLVAHLVDEARAAKLFPGALGGT